MRVEIKFCMKVIMQVRLNMLIFLIFFNLLLCNEMQSFVQVEKLSTNLIAISWKVFENDSNIVYRYWSKNLEIDYKYLKKTDVREITNIFCEKSKDVMTIYNKIDHPDGFYFYFITNTTKFEEIDIKNNVYFSKGVRLFYIEGAKDLNRYYVKDIFVKNLTNKVIICWNTDYDLDDYIFKIYRTHVLITNLSQFVNLKPYKVLTNEFYFEDDDIKKGKYYYYTIILENYIEINAGINMNLQPVYNKEIKDDDIKIDKMYIKELVQN